MTLNFQINKNKYIFKYFNIWGRSHMTPRAWGGLEFVMFYDGRLGLR